ncbi:MAG: hypothetical protein Q9177_005560 [Variospora cf. flavescens]
MGVDEIHAVAEKDENEASSGRVRAWKSEMSVVMGWEKERETKHMDVGMQASFTKVN